MHRRHRLPALVIVMTGCGSGPLEETVATTVMPPAVVTTTVTSAAVDQPSEPTVAPQREAASPADGAESTQPSVVPTGPSTPELVDGCRLIADLDDTAELLRWQVVNDGVMGGRSSADAVVDDSVLVVTGEIVTEGGGFSSVRLALDEPLGDASRLVLRVRTDGRSYEFTAADAAPGRDRRVSHQAVIPASGTGDWEEVVVELDDLDASIFGRSVSVDPFDPTSAVEVGVILADGTDGPFRFELDRIDACE